MENTKQSFLIVRDGNILARCYSKKEVKDRIKELLGVRLESEYQASQTHMICDFKITVWIEGKQSNHVYHLETVSPEDMNELWNDILKSDWFYDETGVELFTSCSVLD